MQASLIVDMWNTFKDSIDKKNIEVVAEKFIDTCADHGADDIHLKDAMGICDILDSAITYYLDVDENIEYDEDEDEWDD